MATTRAMLERRRSSRVPIRIPVKIFFGESPLGKQSAPAEAVSVSRHGALLRVPFRPALGSRIELQHEASPEPREFRMISARGPKEDGLFDLAVEMFYPAQNFWGIQFPGEISLA
jgi:PilZ domain